MDFWRVPYLCPSDSSDSHSPRTDKEKILSVRGEQLSVEMPDT